MRRGYELPAGNPSFLPAVHLTRRNLAREAARRHTTTPLALGIPTRSWSAQGNSTDSGRRAARFRQHQSSDEFGERHAQLFRESSALRRNREHRRAPVTTLDQPAAIFLQRQSRLFGTSFLQPSVVQREPGLFRTTFLQLGSAWLFSSAHLLCSAQL